MVVDPVFGAAATAALPRWPPGGRLVNLGGASPTPRAFSSAVLRSRSSRCSATPTTRSPPSNGATRSPRRPRHAAEGRIEVAHEAGRSTEVEEAWARQAGEVDGRLVLVP